MNPIKKKILNFKTKHKEGFVKSDIIALIKEYPGLDVIRFKKALEDVTGIFIDGEMVYYHCDIEQALRNGINRFRDDW